MNKIFDFIICLLLSSMLVTATLNKEMFLSFHWFGIACCITTALVSSKWHDDEINNLKDEIKDIKNKLNNKED